MIYEMTRAKSLNWPHHLQHTLEEKRVRLRIPQPSATVQRKEKKETEN